MLKRRIAVGLLSLLVSVGGAFAGGASVVKPAASPSSSASTSSGTSTAPSNALQLFTLQDLQGALNDAQSQNDQIAVACYQALIPLVQSAQAPVIPKSLGAFQAFQKARDLQRITVDQTTQDKFKLACGPLVLDTQTTALLLASRIGLAIPGGVAAKAAGAVGITASVGLVNAVMTGLRQLPSN